MTTFVIAWCALTMLVAGLVKGVVGIGLPLVSLPLLTLALPVPVAVALLPIPMLLSNIYQSFASGHLTYAVKRFWPLLLAMFVGTFLGANLLAEAALWILDAIAGATLLIFSFTMVRPTTLRLPVTADRLVGATAGFLGGMLGGVTGVFGPPILVFLGTLDLDKDRFVGCITTVYMISGLGLLSALLSVEVMRSEEILASAFATVPLFGGMLIGERLRGRIDERVFRSVLLAVIGCAGAQLLWRAFTAVG